MLMRVIMDAHGCDFVVLMCKNFILITSSKVIPNLVGV